MNFSEKRILNPDELSMLRDALSDTYPLYEQGAFLQNEIVNRDGKSGINVNPLPRYLLFNTNRDTTIELTPLSVLLDERNYRSYDEFKTKWKLIVDNIESINKDIKIRRVGLRYINEISKKELPGEDTGAFLSTELNSALNYYTNYNELVKYFNTIEYKKENFRIVFKYGFYNPDYPAVDRKQIILLDYDAFIEGEIEFDQVDDCIDAFHEEITRLYESHIRK